MITGMAVSLKNDLLAVYADRIDSGADPSTLLLYEAPAPTPGDPVGAQRLLATIPMPRPFAADISDGLLTANAFDSVMATAGGFAGWCRVIDGDGNWFHDGDVTDNQGDGFFRLEGGTNILAGGLVIVAGCTIGV